MSKAILMFALGGVLVAGAAATSLLSGGTLHASAADVPERAAKSPVANRDTKQDRLMVMSLAQASMEQPPSNVRSASEILRQAYASSSATDVEAAKAVAVLPPVAVQPAVAVQPVPAALPQPAKPKVVVKPAPPKSYSLLSDAQIAGVKDRLRLSSSQEYYWPGVETALRAVARRINAAKLSNPQAGASQLDPDCEEVQQLKSAAMPLLFQLREDQKDEVRKLARIIGLEKVAASI